jgi:hypothetical protein
MTAVAESEVAAQAHTPGPWKWMTTHGGSIFLGTPDRGWLVVMDLVKLGVNHKPLPLVPRFAVWPGRDRGRIGGVMVPADEKFLGIHPDACLIAAAPDLLAACRDFVREVKTPPSDSTMAELMARTQAAIAKAEGK